MSKPAWPVNRDEPVSRKFFLHRSFVLLLLLFSTNPGGAEPVEQFFARRTVTIVIGYTAGGSYDLYGRMIARHLGRHIPGQPTVIAQNMPYDAGKFTYVGRVATSNNIFMQWHTA